MDKAEVEEPYLDVLQNMEAAIGQVDRDSRDLIDLEVLDALDALMKAYIAETSGRAAPFMRLSPLKRKVYDSVREMCEWRLGRAALSIEGNEKGAAAAVSSKGLTIEGVIACLRRLRQSVQFWNGSNGRRGYLEYIHNFGV